MATFTPLPSVSDRMASTGSVSVEFTVCVAPNPLAHSSLRSSISTAMIVCAPASRAPATAALPTPPHPMTATESPRLTPPVFIAAPRPAITPQPISPAAAGLASGSTFTACNASTSVSSQNAPMPRAGDNAVPSGNVIGCPAFRLAKQYQGRPRRHERQSPQGARQARITKSPGTTLVTPSPTFSTTPAASCPSRNGNSSLMAPSR